MSFEGILGQERAIRVLTRALDAGKLPHAYLFHGAEGLGRFKTALAAAQALLCKDRDGDFCGVCSACTRVAGESHPDVLVVRPESRKGAKEWIVDPELGTIRIEQVREFQRWISIRAFEGGWKVGIFDGADKMNQAASNALLKTLEEPPPASLLILISPARSQLLPTIVSRCQPVSFSPLSREDLEVFLSEHREGPEEGVALVSALSGGSPGKAIRMDPQWVVEVRREWIDRLHAFLASGSERELIGFAEDLTQSGRLLEVLELYESWYRDLLVCRIDSPRRIVNRDYMEEVSEACGQQDPTETISKIDAIRKARRDIQGAYNPNKQLLVEALLIGLSGYEA
jgi:DNA polymerase-3 subunit delta'